MSANLAHDQNLSRVRERIAAAVVFFCRARLTLGAPEFHMQTLTAHIRAVVGEVAPDSPGRILRDLRQRGVVEYRLVDRAASLYEVQAVTP